MFVYVDIDSDFAFTFDGLRNSFVLLRRNFQCILHKCILLHVYYAGKQNFIGDYKFRVLIDVEKTYFCVF